MVYDNAFGSCGVRYYIEPDLRSYSNDLITSKIYMGTNRARSFRSWLLDVSLSKASRSQSNIKQFCVCASTVKSKLMQVAPVRVELNVFVCM